jgi:quercetin dioxygenase-like cupin family protein
MPQRFPAFVHSLPEADLPVPGLRGWLLTGETGQVLFLEVHEEVVVPEHTHGDQWGVVVAGRLDLTIDGKTATLVPGQSYVIPAGTPHGARLFAGALAIDYFADRDRYRVRRRAREEEGES